MTEEKWADLVSNIKDKFKVVDHYIEDYDEGVGSAEIYEVEHDIGRLRFIYESIPKKLETKALYSKRGDSVAALTTKYDFDDIIHSLKIERYDEGSSHWVELSADISNL